MQNLIGAIYDKCKKIEYPELSNKQYLKPKEFYRILILNICNVKYDSTPL